MMHRTERLLEFVVIQNRDLIVDIRRLRRPVERALVTRDGFIVSADLCTLLCRLDRIAPRVALLATRECEHRSHHRNVFSHSDESRNSARPIASTTDLTTRTRVYHL